VDSLKGLMRHNGLDRADNAIFRDEPMRFIIGAENQEDIKATEAEIARMRQSGELAEILERMRLD
jgi:hypothetical protein